MMIGHEEWAQKYDIVIENKEGEKVMSVHLPDGKRPKLMMMKGTHAEEYGVFTNEKKAEEFMTRLMKFITEDGGRKNGTAT